VLLLEVETYLKSQEYKSEFCVECKLVSFNKLVNNLNLEGKRRKKRARKNNDDDDDDDVNDDVNDTHTRNKKQKETEPFTDQRENDLSIERTFISNQRQEKDAKRRRTK